MIDNLLTKDVTLVFGVSRRSLRRAELNFNTKVLINACKDKSSAIEYIKYRA